jgi:uncharacterized protein YraI
MMMVDYQSMELSQTFAVGSVVTTNGPANLYLGPGTNYGLIGTLPAGVSAEIVGDINGLDGVKAKGTYWWKVSLPGMTGWAAEENLAAE